MTKVKSIHCAATRCGCVVEQGQAMCRDHWNMLPHNMRTAIIRPYLARQMELYQTEFRKAVDYIERKEGRYTDIFGKVVA